jgi:hypothetical protein
VLAAAAVALVAAALSAPSAGGPAGPGDRGPTAEAAYVQALDLAVGWPAPDAQQWVADVAVGRTICDMLAHGWNEAGVVANMLTWPNNHLTQAQLGAAVHVTHLWLCGQGT